MEDKKMIEQKIDNLQMWLDTKFQENEKCHQEIIEHQKETNGKVKANTEWRLTNTNFLAGLIDDKQYMRHKTIDMGFKVVTVTLLVALGLKTL